LAQRNAASDAAFLLPHLRPGMRLLDIGCGPGTITLGLAEAVAPGEVIGLDLRPEVVAAAQALARERGVTTVRFQVGDAYHLPFPDASFDAVFASQVLFHLQDPLAVLKECRRVLAPAGVAGIRDPDFELRRYLPATPLLEQLCTLEERVFAHNGASTRYARHLRRYLLDAGFARTEASATVMGSGSAGRTRQQAVGVATRFGSVAKVAVAQGWATPATIAAIYADLHQWGERDDAFSIGSLQCEAVGWIDG
jgi:ubiquinone/menaquinone biosynthesis C-methylase UbiE